VSTQKEAFVKFHYENVKVPVEKRKNVKFVRVKIRVFSPKRIKRLLRARTEQLCCYLRICNRLSNNFSI